MMWVKPKRTAQPSLKTCGELLASRSPRCHHFHEKLIGRKGQGPPNLQSSWLAYPATFVHNLRGWAHLPSNANCVLSYLVTWQLVLWETKYERLVQGIPATFPMEWGPNLCTTLLKSQRVPSDHSYSTTWRKSSPLMYELSVAPF